MPPLKQIVEGAMLAAGGPLTLDHLLGLFPDEERPTRDAVLDAIASLERDYQDRGIELSQVAGGYRVQVRREMAPWVARLWEEKPARYSRALLETLALVAYRQPITRGEIEDIRGVAVSTNIVKTLTEREWIRIVGHRDVPGRPALYTTTRKFLDYFGLRSLNDLPTLAEIRDLELLGDDLALEEPEEPGAALVEVKVAVPPDDEEVEGAAGDETEEVDEGQQEDADGDRDHE
jgi:segregation and condensation protein B